MVEVFPSYVLTFLYRVLGRPYIACCTWFRCGLFIIRLEGLEVVGNVNAFFPASSTMHMTYTLEDQP